VLQFKEAERDLAKREGKIKPYEDMLNKKELELKTKEIQVKGR
jgi:hypothetical protein